MRAALTICDSEMSIADEKYGPFASAAEGLGVLLEEFHELRDAVRANDRGSIMREAVQVAAVALRLVESMGNEQTCKRSGC